MKIVLQLVLWVVIAALGYLVYDSVMGPVRFNKVKEVRYAKAIEKLKDIRKSELAFKTVTGKYEGNPEKLIAFLDTAKFTLTQRKDSSFIRFNKVLDIDEPRDTIVIDTLGYASIKDSLFKDGPTYKDMMSFKINDKDINIDLKSSYIDKNGIRIPVFEAKVRKSDILYDLDKDLVAQENTVKSVDAVNDSLVSVGSLTEVKTAGNWPTSYGANDQ
ncbi:hypothetical protein GCM10022393_18610 [Aquimarina addita]|uniref:LPS export ABC transporter periplasmic protein LptC n=1 Tax=Aquimarina addita TaxID=870485 RepID=A0ABP6UH99_9FLAO